MNKYKTRIILCSIGIILTSLTMILTTYAYFSIKVSSENSEIKITAFDENTNIIYNDTSNVTLINAYTGDEIIKTFSVENTSNYELYYDIKLNNVVNNFENKNDLIYTLESSLGAQRLESIVPSTDTLIASFIKIKPLEKHEYILTIKFKKTEFNQNNNMNKTFSSNIDISGSNININEHVYKLGTLLKHIITSYDEDIIKRTYTSIDGRVTYYYTGKDINNNLVYNNKCFKIIRTDENFNIRVIYSGEYVDNTCVYDNKIMSSFNTKTNSNAYVGYMYGTSNSNSYKNEHSNITSSDIKSVLDTWYETNFKDDLKISKNSIYCNNRNMKLFNINGVLYSMIGYGNNNTGYNNINSNIKSYDCINTDDRFSTNNSISNNKLKYPVGLITLDELLFSGADSFLYNLGNYYTMTPAYFDGNNAYNYAVVNNKLKEVKVSDKYEVKPVLSLDKDIKLESGDGSIENPFIVK